MTNSSRIEALLQAAVNGRYTVAADNAGGDTMDIFLIPIDTNRARIVLHALKWNSATRPVKPDRRLWILNRSNAGVAANLRTRNESFVDVTSGVVYVSLPEILIDRTITLLRQAGSGGRAKPAPTRQLRDPFADRASLLSRVLLDSPGREWTVTGLAGAAGVSGMLSTDVIRQFEDWRIIKVSRRGRRVLARLTEPRKLVEMWTTRYVWQRNPALAVAAPVSDEDRFLKRAAEAMKNRGRRCALTLLSGAWRRIQYTSPDRIHMYVDVATRAELSDLAADLGWAPDTSGNVVLMMPRYRDSVWHNLNTAPALPGMHSGDPIAAAYLPPVSDVQLILDLWHYPVRGRETAEQLLRKLVRHFENYKPPARAAE